MKLSYQDGKIKVECPYFQEVRYDLSNERICVATDGCGGLLSYRANDREADALPSFLSLDLFSAGKPLSPYLTKKVEMIGRMQKIYLQTDEAELSITTFLSAKAPGVFWLVDSGDTALDLSLNCRGAKSESRRQTAFVAGENFLLSSSSLGEWVKENDAFYLTVKGRNYLFFSFDASEAEHRDAFCNFDLHFNETLREIEKTKIPASVLSEEEKAMYLAARFTALQNYKVAGDFRAFAAGINYIHPLRTYYRDSYFTLLPLLSSEPTLVKEELLTLARGVGEDGSCPSAVKSDFDTFWGDHYDSPSLFILELYDYVRMTGDRSILDQRIKGTSLLEKVRAILARLHSLTDETGLLYKEGAYNKRDWADEVCRGGYVTYVEALYYRALIAASRLFSNAEESLLFRTRAEKVKDSVNRLLFDEEKGYYVNYKTEDYTEDNLSIDTVFTLLFGIADESRARRVLNRMEELLETSHNALQGGGDFGVMCVYPPYSLPKSTCHKSARAYDYHNGANWCYLTAMYAYAKSLYGKDWRTPLLTTFRYMTEHGHYTPVEYFSPCRPAGSPLQGWSAAIAFAQEYAEKPNFFE